MTVETFGIAEFEHALREAAGGGAEITDGVIESGEWVYSIYLDEKVAIKVRSSIYRDGESAGSSEDSIRLWLVYRGSQKHLGAKVDQHTKRIAGWQRRMGNKIQLLMLWRKLAGDCSKCGQPRKILKVKKSGPSTGRPFAKCGKHGGFQWLDEEEEHAESVDSKVEEPTRGSVALPWDDGQAGQSDKPGLQPVPGVAGQHVPEGTGTSGDMEGQDGEMPPVLDFLAGGAIIDVAFDQEQASRRIVTVPEPVESPNVVELNEHQQAVVMHGVAGPTVVEACPGSGKTRTGEEQIAALLAAGEDPARLGYFTFSNQAARESRRRIAQKLFPEATEAEIVHLEDPSDENRKAALGLTKDQYITWASDPRRAFVIDRVATIHALSYRLLKWYGFKLKVLKREWEWKERELVRDALDELDWDEGYKSIEKWFGMAINELVLPEQSEAWFAGRLELLGGPVWCASKLAEVYRRRQDFMRSNGLIDFNMMQARVVWLLRNDPKFKAWAAGLFNVILVDEAQDTAPIQSEILFALASHGRIQYIGDVDQCVLEGETVLTPSGYIPIERIKKYDKVIAAVGGDQVRERFVTEISVQDGVRTVVTIETKNGYALRVTSNHIVFAVVPGITQATKRHSEDKYYVYLMRKDIHFRIGVSQHPANRLRGEHADCLWIINVAQTRKKAQYLEHYYSAKYGIPTLTFVEHTKGIGAMDQMLIDKLFRSVNTCRAAIRLEKGEGILLTMPHIVARSHSGVERMTLYYTICDAPPQPGKERGRRNSGHLLRGETSDKGLLDLLETAGVNLTQGAKNCMRFRETGTDAKAMEARAKELASILDCELIIDARFGTDVNYSLRPRAMPAGNVHPGFLVPVYDEERGTLVLDEVIDVSVDEFHARVYDLEVMGVANFIAEGIVVHNSMYRFRGAEPEVLRSKFEEAWDVVTRFNLPVNYRSPRSIVTWAAVLIGGNYDEGSDIYLKPFEPGPAAGDGDPVTYTEFEKFGELADEIATLVKERPGDFFILSRTRAECATIHTQLVARGVSSVNKSGGLLLGAPHVRKALAYLRLAANYQDARNTAEVLLEIANVASAQFRAPMTRRRHVGGCDKPPWVDCGCPLVREEGVDYSSARYYGRKAIEQAGNRWEGIKRQRSGKNRGGYPTVQAKGARDLVEFVERLERHADSAVSCLEVVVAECILPWLQAEEGLSDEDLAENGKAEDFQVLMQLIKPGQSVEEYLVDLDTLVAGEGAEGEASSAIVATIHWSKGSQRPAVICNTTRLPIVPPKRNPGRLPTGLPPSEEEERRLLYVAGTRAEAKLYLFGAREWNDQEVETSLFVRQMGMA